MGDVGAVVTFMDDLFKFFAVDPDGWKRQSIERQLEVLHEAREKSIADNDFAAYDRCLAEYDRLQQQTA